MYPKEPVSEVLYTTWSSWNNLFFKKGDNMFITATEVKTNLGKYLMLAETRKILGKLFTLFHLLDTTSLDCRKAISSEIGDYEDAIMVETAIRSEMDCIVTRSVKDYAKSSIKVHEPSALIKLLEEENEAE